MSTWRQWIRPEQIRELSLIGLIVIALLIFGWQIENFLSARTFNRITSSVAIVGMVAIGQTLVVLTRNIDLSVGSIVGFTAYFVGSQLAANSDIPSVMAVILAVLTGGALGLVNGLIVAYGRVPAIITTLGTLAIYRMLLINYANARTITVDSLPPWVVELSRQPLVTIGELAVRPLMLFTVGAVVIFQLVLGYTVFGRRLYAIGSNPEAAHFAGLPAQRTVLTAFVLCGMLAGMAGFLFLARFGNITAVAGQGIELESVAAVVVGGVNTFGGSGTVFGALLGAFLIDLLGQGLLRWLGISEFWRDALLGLLILLAVASDSVILGWLRRLWAAPVLPMEASNER